MINDLLMKLDIAAKLSAATDETAMFELILKTATDITGAQAGYLLLANKSENVLEMKAFYGKNADDYPEPFTAPIETGIAGNVYLSGNPLCIADANSSSGEMNQSLSKALHNIENSIDLDVDDLMVVPISLDQSNLGVIEIINKVDGGHFSQADLNIMTSFSRMVAMTIRDNATDRNIRHLLIQACNNPSQVDALTQYLDDSEYGSDLGTALRLADLIVEIVNRGKTEMDFCCGLLRTVVDYLEDQPRCR